MILIFGATTDIGVRLVKNLRDAEYTVATASRSSRADYLVDLDTGHGIADALAHAEIIVSCAHARYTTRLLQIAPTTVRSFIFTGSAWRYSTVPNPRADEVREAERVFLASGRDGVMLHPTMIYGGRQENNISRLLALIRRFPVIPAPGGGRNKVQPIYIDDVVDSLFAATKRKWRGPNVIPIGGPPLEWREMAELCGQTAGYPRRVMAVPIAPIVLALSALKRLGIARLDAGVVGRFTENVSIPVSAMREELAISPRDFRTGIRLAIEGWRREGLSI